MNIRDHIAAGHYPKDGEATLVPTRGGDIARIYAATHPGGWPILGVVREGDGAHMWRSNGRISDVTPGPQRDDDRDLLPPAQVKRSAARSPAAIDWSRPLRTVEVPHRTARVESIDPYVEYPVRIRIDGVKDLGAYVDWFSRDGKLKGKTEPMIENVPAPPTIVERFALVSRSNDYSFESGLMTERTAAEEVLRSRDALRLARVLIEEPGE